MQEDPITRHRPIVHLLEPGERVELVLSSGESDLRVTDRRIIVTAGEHVRLLLAYDELRRIQFDIETMRPATMVIVPHRPSQEPQVLAVPREQMHHAAEVLAFVAERLP